MLTVTTTSCFSEYQLCFVPYSISLDDALLCTLTKVNVSLLFQFYMLPSLNTEKLSC